MSNKGIKKTKRTIFKKEPLRRDKKSMYNIFTNININIIVWKKAKYIIAISASKISPKIPA